MVGLECGVGGGGWMGTRDACSPPLGQDIFILLQFSGKIGQIVGWHLWKILDPPPTCNIKLLCGVTDIEADGSCLTAVNLFDFLKTPSSNISKYGNCLYLVSSEMFVWLPLINPVTVD